MSYGIRYIAQWRDHRGAQKRISLFRSGYEGEPENWKLVEKSGIKYDLDAGDSLFSGSRVCPTVASFGLYFEEATDFSEFLNNDFRVQVENLSLPSDNIEFVGFIEPWDLNRPYSKPLHLVSFTATCGLSKATQLKYKNYATQNNKSQLEVLHDCLFRTGLELDLITSVHIAPGHMVPNNGDPLKSVGVDVYRFNSDQEWLSIGEVLNDLAHKYNAQLFQHRGRWIFVSRPDQFIGTHTYSYKYPFNSSSGTFQEGVAYEKSIDYGDGFSLNGGTVSVHQAIQKFVIKADFGDTKEFFENGDLKNFVGGVFPSWNLDKMSNSSDDGWSKVNSNDEYYPNAILITGHTPHWIVLKKFYFGNVVNGIKFNEPSQYIESPVGSFDPSIYGISVEFEYAISKAPGIFTIAVGFRNSQNGDVFWYGADKKNKVGIHDEWIGIDVGSANSDNVNTSYNPRYKFRLDIPVQEGLKSLKKKDRRVDQVFIRFYKKTEANNDSSPWYKLFWLKGRTVLDPGEQKGAKDLPSGQYETEFSYQEDPTLDDELNVETINLITGDYAPGFSGSLHPYGNPWGVIDHWKRPGISEEVSNYYAFVTQRQWMTWRHLMVLEVDVKLKNEQEKIYFIDHIYVGPWEKKFQIVRYSWDDYHRTVSLRLIELMYSEPDLNLIRNSFNVNGDGKRSRIMSENGGSDNIYPSSNTGNTIGDELPPDDELEYGNILHANGRLPNIFNPIDPILFVRGLSQARSIDLYDYLIEDYFNEDNEHDVNDFSVTVTEKPIWLTEVSSNVLAIEMSGKGTETGEFVLLVKVYDAETELSLDVRIRLIVIDAPSLTYTLNSTKLIPSQPVTLPHAPPYTLTVQVKGGHDAYRWVHRFAGTVQYDSDIIPVSNTETATYTPISSESLAQGIHVVFFQLFRQTGVDENDDPIYTAISGDDLIFKLGSTPENPERTVKLELVTGRGPSGSPAGTTLGEIPGTYEYVESWDIVPLPRGIKYDELFLSILPEEEPYTTTLTPDLTGISYATDSLILDGSTGEVAPDAGYVTTDPISVTPGQEYWMESAPYSAAGYNSGVFVTELSGETITIPAGVNQIRLCWYDGALMGVWLAELTGSLFNGDAPKGSGNFTVFARALLAGGQEYERMAELVILEKEPEEPVEQEGIVLIQPGSPVTKLADPIPATGYITTLPTSWALLFPGFGTIQYDKITWKLFHGLEGMTEVSLPMYTGNPSEKSYTSPVTAAAQLLFWGKSSLDIGTIHVAPTRILAEVTGYLSGQKVAVAKADWIFSNTPIGPGTGMAYGYYDASANVLMMQDPNVPATGKFYKLLVIPGQFWVVGALTWNSSTQYNKVEVEVNGIIVKTWTGALTSANADQADILDWNRAVPGLDEPGEKNIKQRFYNGATLIGTKEATITLLSENPEIKDPNDCCTGGGTGEHLRADFPTPATKWTWNHGLGRTPVGLRIIIDNEEWQSRVVHVSDNTTEIFFNSPRAGYIVAD